MQGESFRLSRSLNRSLTQLSPQLNVFSSRFPSASPPFSDEDSSVSAGIGAGHRRRSSFDYHRLPDSLLRLSVLKLDGSSFDVQITGDACVNELKGAIEDIFIGASPAEGVNDDISWSHVWGHFCLCFNDHKLTDDKASIRTYGIKDGDQLHFIRQLSLDQLPGKRRTKSCVAELNLEDNKLSWSRRKILQFENEDGPKYVQLADHDDVVVYKGSKFGRLFNRWFSYSRLRTFPKSKSEKWSNAKSTCKGHRAGSKK